MDMDYMVELANSRIEHRYTYPKPKPFYSNRKVGGIRFIRLGRFNFSFSRSNF